MMCIEMEYGLGVGGRGTRALVEIDSKGHVGRLLGSHVYAFFLIFRNNVNYVPIEKIYFSEERKKLRVSVVLKNYPPPQEVLT